MGINVFQIGELNTNFFGGNGGSFAGTSVASEFPLVFDNINASGSRLAVIYGVYGSVSGQQTLNSGISNDSYGQPTNTNNGNDSNPLRPTGSYFTRTLQFSGTAAAPNANRNGYVGSFVSGAAMQAGFYGSGQYAHDINGTTVDYGEPIYSHGQFTSPQTANFQNQWRDSSNPPSDGTDLIVTSGSALTRTQYMPPSYYLFHIDSPGANTVGSGNVKFHFEQRPTLRAAGYDDGNRPYGANGSLSASFTINATPGPYSSDPLGGFSNNPTENWYEYYQATGVRKLNSRGLSLHIAKVMDNSWAAYGYVYEEDGITLSPSAVTGFSGHPVDLSVNTQTEYTWVRDQAAAVTFVYSDGSGNSTFTCNNTFTVGMVVLVNGMTNATWANGRFFTITSLVGSGPTYTGFVATGYNPGAYGPTTEIVGGTGSLPAGYAVFNPDFRIRQAATFHINEEYYGFVADTKCTIWSNKASMLPLLFFDLKDKWTSDPNPRIAGVSVIPTYINTTGQLMYQLFFVSEGGSLVRYDFTQTNGALELAGTGSFAFASNAPTPVAAGEAYGSTQARSTSATITNVTITSNVLTVACTNTFEAGQVVNLTGLTAATFLNNQTVTVASAGGSSFTASYTHANYASTPDTGTAVGWEVWVMYGTMTADPRTTQSGLANNANINLFRYNIGLGTWTGPINSGLPGRHNGRNLHEMIVKRDGNIYMLIEDVATSAGFTVSNSFGVISGPSFTLGNVNWQIMVYDPTTATWNTSKINGSTLLQYGANQGPLGVNYVQSSHFWFYNINAFLHDVNPNALLVQPNWTCAAPLQVLNTTSSPTLTNSNLTPIPVGYGNPNGGGTPGALFITNNGFPIPNYFDPSSVSTAACDIVHNRDFAINGDRTVFFAPIYMQTYGGSGQSSIPIYVAPPSFSWLTATTPNAGTVNVSGVSVTWVSGPQFTNVWAGWPINIAGQVYTVQTVSSPTSLSLTASAGVVSGATFNIPLLVLGSNTSNGSQIQDWYNDAWTFQQVGLQQSNAGDHAAWCFPHSLQDNYMCFVRPSSGADGLPAAGSGPCALYGRIFGQAMTYLATYWKWNGSAWIMADTYQDAQNNPYTIPAYSTFTSVVNTSVTSVTWVSGPVFSASMQGQAVSINGVFYTVATFNSTTSLTLTTSAGTQTGVNMFFVPIPLPYGLQCQFGPASGTSYSGGEFSTWNVCWGNTKYTRQGRFSWAMFAGQTFVNSETRTLATQNAMSINFIDTDLFSSTTTAPTSITPNTAPIASYPLGWKTQFTWPKLDSADAGYDATPFQTVLTVNSFNPDTWAYPANNSGTYSWTVGGNTYVASSISDQGLQSYGGEAWAAFAGNPQYYWLSNNQNSGWVQIDLGSGNNQTVLSYEWRPVWDTGDNFATGNIQYQLLGSTTGAFLGEQVVVDDRTGGNAISNFYRGLSFNCNGTTGAYRYYRFNIVSGASSYCKIGMIRMNTSVMVNTCNFTDFVFFAYGSQATNGYQYQFLRNWQWARGITIEVSTNNGGTYTTIMEPNGTVAGGTAPLWRMHNGFGFVFPRQIGVTNIRITVQHGYNMITYNNTNVPLTSGFGPFYLLDYEPQNPTGMVATNAARLGSSLATQGTAPAASFDQQCLGIATDVASISIDGSSPNLFSAYQVGIDSAILSFYDFATVPLTNGGNLPTTAGYKMHPFFGFILFPGAGADGNVSTQSGTNMGITYQWGRRV